MSFEPSKVALLQCLPTIDHPKKTVENLDKSCLEAQHAVQFAAYYDSRNKNIR
jgi:hypothetical protein